MPVRQADAAWSRCILIERLHQADWGSDAEMRWVIRRTASLAGWTVPTCALEKEKS